MGETNEMHSVFSTTEQRSAECHQIRSIKCNLDVSTQEAKTAMQFQVVWSESTKEST